MNKEKTITLQVPEGKRAEWVNGVPTMVDELPVDITERVKTLKDAVEILGANNPLVAELNSFDTYVKPMSKDIEAYLKLRIITAALNEGWSPTFYEKEMRYYPFYVFYRKEEVLQMNVKRKRALGLFFGGASVGLACGLADAYALNAWSGSHSTLGSRLAYKSRDRALYSARQFPELWYQFLITLQVPEGKRAEWVNGVPTRVDELPVDITERVKTLEDAAEILGANNPLVAELNSVKPMNKDIEAYLKLRIEWVNGVPTMVDELPVDITERVKTLEDAAKILGANNPLVAELNSVKPMSKDIEAYLKLRIITATLNEGWSPTFSKGENRFFPYYVIYTKEEVLQMNVERKRALGLFFGGASDGLACGLAAAISYNAWSLSHSGIGSRLAYKSRDRALYSARQFPELWCQFLIGDNQKQK